MYTLYYIPGACSMAVHVALNEIGAPVTLKNVSVSDGQPRPAEFLALNPRGSVPVLQADGFAIRENMAILTYLLDTHKSPLLPQSGAARAQALEWLAFANATLHPAYGRAFFLGRQFGATAAENPVYQAAIDAIQKYWDEIETRLQSQPYLCGTECTMADILVTVIANWAGWLKKPIQFGTHTKEYLRRVSSRPSYQKALASEQIEYKAAA